MDNYSAPLLLRLEGTTVTTYDDVPVDASPPGTRFVPSSPSSLPLSNVTPAAGISQTWVITEKLSEDVCRLTEEDVRMGCGTSKTVGKFLCSLVDDPSRIAFMRIYQQIPIAGTENAALGTLAQQAVQPPMCPELETFKQLKRKDCVSAPRLLGYAERVQGEQELLPGGYVQYIVWEKVPGEPLTEKVFWGFERDTRDAVRSKFRLAYEQVVRFGASPGGLFRISKIIYDQSTGALHISGFRGAFPVEDDLEWSDLCYAEFGLVKPCLEDADWYDHPENWEW